MADTDGRDLARTLYEAVFYEKKAREPRDAVKLQKERRYLRALGKLRALAFPC
jgi:hypothetical protein